MTNQKKLRKLFPTFASEKNKEFDCSIGICDTTCPYNCYQEPPWSNTAPSPAISAVYQDSQKPSSSIDAITITTVTGAVLLILLTGFFLVAKLVSDSVNRVEHERYQSERDGDGDTVEEEEQMDNPIWLIRTTGLQQSTINSIMICNYKRGDGMIERTDCPVCLNEFEEDESLRLLPKCNHAFHISCIDTWLRSHINCPLCRAGISVSDASPRWSAPVVVVPGEENGGQNVQLQISSDSIDSGESNGEAMRDSGISESGISSKTTGSSSSVSRFSKDKSLIFPLK